jgi:hypothetical protein
MRKIGLLAVIWVAVVGGCSTKNQSSENGKHQTVRYDTVFFSADLALEGDCKRHQVLPTDSPNFLLFNTIGRGQGLWLDTIVYSKCWNDQMAIVGRTADRFRWQLVYYSGDSLQSTIVSINRPTINEFKMNGFTVITLSDTIYNSGTLTRTNNLHVIDYSNRSHEIHQFHQGVDIKTKLPRGFLLSLHRKNDDTLVVQKMILADRKMEHYYISKQSTRNKHSL